MEAKMIHDHGLLVIQLLQTAQATVHHVGLRYVRRELVEGDTVISLDVGIKQFKGPGHKSTLKTLKRVSIKPARIRYTQSNLDTNQGYEGGQRRPNPMSPKSYINLICFKFKSSF